LSYVTIPLPGSISETGSCEEKNDGNRKIRMIENLLFLIIMCTDYFIFAEAKVTSNLIKFQLKYCGADKSVPEMHR
jgi:hypothetical protein